MRLLLRVVFISLLLGQAIASDLSQWQVFTSAQEVRYLDYFNDSLQVVTSGGWLKVDPYTLGIKKITNIMMYIMYQLI